MQRRKLGIAPEQQKKQGSNPILSLETVHKLPPYRSPRVSSEIPDCSMPFSFDSYSICSLGCRYCFANYFKSNNPLLKSAPPIQAVDVGKFEKMITGKSKSADEMLFYEHFFSKRFILHWGGLADPFCAIEKKYGVGYELLTMLGDMNYPTLFSFKGPTVFEDKYLQLFEKYKHQQNFAFQISIVTSNDKLARQVEVGVPPPSRRFEAMKLLSDMGYWTILRLRPFIIGVTDLDLTETLERARDAGARGVSTEFFAIDMRINDMMRDVYKKMGEIIHVPDLQKYFKALSPSERGGYMRLNRLVKEPYIKEIYKFCCANDMVFASSDPDFKELCMTGNCCGMPEQHPDNPDLDNWSTQQLTHHLKEARRTYHRTGERVLLKFDEVYGDNSYFDSTKLAAENCGIIDKIYAYRVRLTQRYLLQMRWNSPKNPSAPNNYFHGRVLPIGLDGNDNMIYKYNPGAYEDRWAEQGIDMCR